jgi:tetratricopeptide (TPR) repeat protein
MRYLTLLFVAIFFTVPAFAQPGKADSLLAVLKTAEEDTNKANILNELSSIYFQQDAEKSKDYGRQMLELSTRLNWDRGIMRGNNLVARCYAVQNNQPMALKHFQAALVAARKLKSARYEGIMLSSISAVYASNDDYDKALKYAFEARKVNEAGGIKYMPNLMINIGYLYIRQEKAKEALPYYQEALKMELAYGTPETRGELANIYLNLGGVYIRTGDFVATLENYFKAAAMTRELGNTSHYTFAIADIGETYVRIAEGKSTRPLPDSLRNNAANLVKAERYLQEALALGKQLQLIDIQSEVNASLSTMHRLRGQYKEAYEYYKTHITLRDSLRDIEKEKQLARVEAEFAVRQHTDSLNYQNALKDKEITRRKLERNGGILLISLAGVIGLLLINRQKLKHIQKRKIAETEKHQAEEMARLQLADFTKSIQEKNDLLETFRNEIEKYQAQPNSQEQAEKEKSLQLLQNAVILNDEQWVNFQALFNKVHTGYINRVKEKFPDLTTAELRFILLTKLGLNNKEMAAMLGVSTEAVRVSKHRLLKKIQLPEDVSLEEAVHTI